LQNSGDLPVVAAEEVV